MSDPRTIRFYDYYEAQLVAHQLAEEGHRAEVYEHCYNLAPWPGAEYRLVVFENGLSGDPDEDGHVPEFGEIGSSPLADLIDSFLRTVTVAGMALVPAYLFYLLLNKRPPEYDPLHLVVKVLMFVIFYLVGMTGSITAYHSFRAQKPFGTVVISGVGWFICICYLINFAIILISLRNLL